MTSALIAATLTAAAPSTAVLAQAPVAPAAPIVAAKSPDKSPGKAPAPAPRTAAAGDVVFPGKDWATNPPVASAIPAEKVEEAMALLKTVLGKDGTSQTVVIHNGYMIWAGEDIDNKHIIWSCTKSFMSTCFGLLWDDGKCAPDDLASKYLPELAKDYPAVTVRHLATFTSGVKVPKDTIDFTEPDYPVGTAMHYSAQSDLLARILTKIAGEPLQELFRRRIAEPIGMDPAQWEWKHVHIIDGVIVNGGAGHPTSGIHTNARNLARFGWLYANGGNWNGRQLISKRYIDFATRNKVDPALPPHDPKGWYTCLPGRYGFNWWTNGVDAKGEWLWPDVPASSFAAQGNRNNICIIVPEWKLVLVRMGNDNGNVGKFNGPLKILGEAIPGNAPRK
ncbi:hypothetical protein DB346_07850 [Verrucomicrobia bacterium LW23]|nr:hypothetical protein DB346_07850 [Verrucomicrobia bacterium LW23]